MRPVHVFVCLATLSVLAPGLLAGSGSATTGTTAYWVYAAPAGLPDVNNAGEPSLGINPLTGKVLFQAWASTYRVGFNDATLPATAAWADVTPVTSLPNADPILFTDTTTGRTFAGGLQGACSTLSFTDDDGATWAAMTNACSGASADHETIGSGAWRNGVKPVYATSTRAVYYCAQLQLPSCATSADGGVTFLPPVPAPCGYINSGFHGSVHVTVRGAAILPFKTCGGNPGFAVSTTNGISWVGRRVVGVTETNQGFDPDVASTPSGRIYLAYMGGDRHPYVTVTNDEGLSFSTPVDVGASAGIQQSTFHEMVAGDNDRAAVAYLGSTTAGNGFDPSFAGVWHLYVSTTLDGGATWSTVQVTTDPVQRGHICDSGTTCDLGEGHRNLLDFMDAQVDEDGRIVVAFADGCIGACAGGSGTIAQSNSAWATIARQSCGPSLFAALGDVQGTATCTLTAPPVATTPLAGTFYARGVLPVGNADATLADVFGASLSPTPPTSGTPKAMSTGVALRGVNAGAIYEANFFLPTTGGAYTLTNDDVEVRLFLSSVRVNTGLLPVTLNVSLFDANPDTFSAWTTALANKQVVVPNTLGGPVEVVVTFPGLTATLLNGLHLSVDNIEPAATEVLYDATSTPTRVIIT